MLSEAEASWRRKQGNDDDGDADKCSVSNVLTGIGRSRRDGKVHEYSYEEHADSSIVLSTLPYSRAF